MGAKNVAAQAGLNVAISLQRKGGGATVGATVAIWKDPETNAPTRLMDLVFDDWRSPLETINVSLPKGLYQVVSYVLIQESISGTYDYKLSCGQEVLGENNSDVNKSAAMGETRTIRHSRNLLVP